MVRCIALIFSDCAFYEKVHINICIVMVWLIIDHTNEILCTSIIKLTQFLKILGNLLHKIL